MLLDPQHPYTQALIAALPDISREPAGATGRRTARPDRHPPGCRFHPRCPRRAALPPGDERAQRCLTDVPVIAAGAPDRSLVACHLVDLDPPISPRRPR